jgi:hypothetical protein
LDPGCLTRIKNNDTINLVGVSRNGLELIHESNPQGTPKRPKKLNAKPKRVLFENRLKVSSRKSKEYSIKNLNQKSPDKTQKNLLIESSSIYP